MAIGGNIRFDNVQRDGSPDKKNHKPNDKSRKRQEKRDKEQEVLGLFREVGIQLAKELRNKIGNKKGELETPPPYAPPYDETHRQLPVMSGTVQIRGHVDFEEDGQDKGNGGEPDEITNQVQQELTEGEEDEESRVSEEEGEVLTPHKSLS